MRIALRLLLIAAATYLLMPITPWWSAACVGFGVGLVLSERRRKHIFETRRQFPPFSFWAGFVAVAAAWGLMAFFQDLANQSLLSNRMVQLVASTSAPIEFGQYYLIAVTSLIGGLIGGLSTLTGNSLGEAIRS